MKSKIFDIKDQPVWYSLAMVGLSTAITAILCIVYTHKVANDLGHKFCRVVVNSNNISKIYPSYIPTASPSASPSPNPLSEAIKQNRKDMLQLEKDLDCKR